MDIGTVLTAFLGSSVLAAAVSGGVTVWSQNTQRTRNDRASRRQVRIEARAFARHVLNARQHGFGTIDGIPTTRAALSDLLGDRDILTALTDKKATALADAVRDSDGLAALMVRSNGEELKDATAEQREQMQMQIRGMANGAFIALRRYFELIDDGKMVEDFDKAEREGIT